MKKVAVFVITCLTLIFGANYVSVAFASELSDSVILHLTATHTGNQVVIDANLITNTGLSAIGLELEYDKNVFKFSHYERGSALSGFDLEKTGDYADESTPIRFLWDNQNVVNDFSTGKLLSVYFDLEPDCKAGEYNIRFKPFDVEYIDSNKSDLPILKKAVIDKAVINVAENKITDIEIAETDFDDGETNVALLIGAAVFGGTALSAAVAVITVKIIKKRRGKGRWTKI